MRGSRPPAPVGSIKSYLRSTMTQTRKASSPQHVLSGLTAWGSNFFWGHGYKSIGRMRFGLGKRTYVESQENEESCVIEACRCEPDSTRYLSHDKKIYTWRIGEAGICSASALFACTWLHRRCTTPHLSLDITILLYHFRERSCVHSHTVNW